MLLKNNKTIDMTAEEFYKDHFGHTSQHVSMDKILVCMELYAKQYANQRVIKEMDEFKLWLYNEYPNTFIDIDITLFYKLFKKLKQ